MTLQEVFRLSKTTGQEFRRINSFFKYKWVNNKHWCYGFSAEDLLVEDWIIGDSNGMGQKNCGEVQRIVG